MQRRKFVVGLGSLAAGGAATIGTGAFTTAEVTRGADISIANDESAFLALKSGVENGEYTDKDAGKQPTNTLRLALNGNAPGDGSGLNWGSEYRFDDLFRIVNQTDEKKEVFVEHGTPSPDFMNDNDVVFYPNGGSSPSAENNPPSIPANGYGDANGMEDSSNAQVLNPGTSINVGLYIDTGGREYNPNTGDPDNVASFSDFGQIVTSMTVRGHDNP